MKGDFSRFTFDRSKHYHSVLLQQGRVHVDADWNEDQAIQQYLRQTALADIVGGTGAPEHGGGFRIFGTDDGKLRLSAGRLYAEGLLCENEVRVEIETRDLATDDGQLPDGAYVAYLDAWLHHVTALEDNRLLEKALGGPDTATRLRVVWQVRFVPITWTPGNLADALGALLLRRQAILAERATTPEEALRRGAELALIEQYVQDLARQIGLDCESAGRAVDPLRARTTGRLTVRTRRDSGPPVPCAVTAPAGYLGLENQHYRVEIHRSGSLGAATFKWSRENGSVVTAIKSVSGSNLTVSSTGPDASLGFSPGDWVEVMDESAESRMQRSSLRRIVSVSPENSTIQLDRPAGLASGLLRRWDQNGESAGSDGVKTQEGELELEDGIVVEFSAGLYCSGDYWSIPARTQTGEVEWPPFGVPNSSPTPEPPIGERHVLVPLAVVGRLQGFWHPVLSCRPTFPSLTKLGSQPRVIRITGIFLGGTNARVALFNDTAIEPSDLAKGIDLFCDAPVNPAVLSAAICLGTVELPFHWNERVVGYNELRVDAVTTSRLLSLSASSIDWRPTPATQQWMQEELPRIAKSRLLFRLKVRGRFVWAANEHSKYLDGEAFGVPAPDRTVGLRPPTGDGVPGGDFDMWLWITRIQRTLSLTVSPFQIIGGDTARVGAEVSAQLSQDTPLAFTSTSPNFLFTSVPVALPAGSRVVEAAAVTLPVLEAMELDVGAQLGPPANITSNRVRVRVLPRFLKVVSVSFLAGARSDNPDVVRRLTTNPQSIANFNELIDGVELVFNVPLADSLLDDDVSLTLFPERNPARVPVNSRLTSAEQLVVSWEHAAGSFEFRLSGSADSRLRGQANQPFDGEARQLPSGDDAAGGDFVIKFSVGPG